MTDELLKKLISEIESLHRTIGIMQEDINAIRNGQYEAPLGATALNRKKVPTRTMKTDAQLVKRDW